MGILAIIGKIKSISKKEVEQGLDQLIPIVNAPQNALILHDINVEHALVPLLALDPIAHWKIVGGTLHSLFTLALEPLCALTMIQMEGFVENLRELFKAERMMVQRLSGALICRVCKQPPHLEGYVFANKSLLSLLLSLLYQTSEEVKLDALQILEEVTYHCDHTTSLCSLPHNNLLTAICTILQSGSPPVILCCLKVLRNAACNSHVSDKILHSLRGESAALEMQLLELLEKESVERGSVIRHASISSIASSPSTPLSISLAEKQETRALILECLWYIRSCFSRIRSDSVQPESSQSNFLLARQGRKKDP